MGGLLSDLKAGLDSLQKISKELSEVELREAILQQRKLLLDAKEELLELRERNSDLVKENSELKLASRRRFSQTEVEGFKFDEVEGKPTGLPYCPKCEVSENGALYRMKRLNDRYSECPNCKNDFNVGSDGSVHEQTPPRQYKHVKRSSRYDY